MDAHQTVASYWITVRGIGMECRKASQAAVLRYEDSPALPLHSSLTSPSGYVSACNSFLKVQDTICFFF